MGDACTNSREKPDSCEKVEMNDETETLLALLKGNQRNINDKIRRQESCYGDMLLMLLPEKELPNNEGARQVTFPEFPRVFEKFEESIESEIVCDNFSCMTLAVKKVELLLSAARIFGSKKSINALSLKDYFAPLPSALEVSEEDNNISDWKSEEKRYRGLQYLTLCPENTGHGVPSIRNKPKESKESSKAEMLPTESKTTSSAPKTSAFTTTPITTTTAAKPNHKLISEKPTPRTKIFREEPFQSPLDSFLMLRTGFKCSTPRDTPRFPPSILSTSMLGTKKIGVVPPVASVSAAKVKPMIVSQHKRQEPDNSVTTSNARATSNAVEIDRQKDVYPNVDFRIHQESPCSYKNNGMSSGTVINTNHNKKSLGGNEEDFSMFISTSNNNELFSTSAVNSLQTNAVQNFKETHDSSGICSDVNISNPIPHRQTPATVDCNKAPVGSNDIPQYRAAAQLTGNNNNPSRLQPSNSEISMLREHETKAVCIDIQLTEEFRVILLELEKDCSSLFAYLKDMKSIKSNGNLFIFNVHQTRFLLKEEENKHRTQNSDKDVLCGLVCLHALTQTVELIVHCNIPTACGVLKSVNQKYRTVLHNCLEPIRKKLIGFHCQNEEENIYHPKFKKVKDLILETAIKDFAVKHLVLIGRYFEQTAPLLKSFLTSEDSIVVTSYPNSNVDQSEYMNIFMSSNVIIAEESEDLQTCPWKYFHYVIQYDCREESEWDVLALNKNPSLKGFSMLNVVMDGLHNTCEQQLISPIVKSERVLVCDQGIIAKKPLLIALERQNNIHLVPKDYKKCLLRSDDDAQQHHVFTTQPHFLVNAATCVHVFFENVLTNTDENEILLEIVSVILKCSLAHVIIALEKNSCQNSPRIADKLISVIAVLRKNLSHVTIRTWYTFSTEDLAKKIRMICDKYAHEIPHKEIWNAEYWCKDRLSQQEMFLMSYPFMNVISVEIFLQGVNHSLKTLFTMSLDELKRIFLTIPQHVIYAFNKANNNFSSFNTLPSLNESITQQQQQQQQRQRQQPYQQLAPIDMKNYYYHAAVDTGNIPDLQTQSTSAVPLEELMYKHNDRRESTIVFESTEETILPCSNQSFSDGAERLSAEPPVSRNTKTYQFEDNGHQQIDSLTRQQSEDQWSASTQHPQTQGLPNQQARDFKQFYSYDGIGRSYQQHSRGYPDERQRAPHSEVSSSAIYRQNDQLNHQQYSNTQNSDVDFNKIRRCNQLPDHVYQDRFKNPHQRYHYHDYNGHQKNASIENNKCRIQDLHVTSFHDQEKIDFPSNHVNLYPNSPRQPQHCQPPDPNTLRLSNHLQRPDHNRPGPSPLCQLDRDQFRFNRGNDVNSRNQRHRPFSRSFRQEDKENIPRQAVKGYTREIHTNAGRPVSTHGHLRENNLQYFQHENVKVAPTSPCHNSHSFQNSEK